MRIKLPVLVTLVCSWLGLAAQNEVLYMWSGALTGSSVKVNARLQDTDSLVRLVVSTDPSFSEKIYSGYQPATRINGRIVSLNVNDLIAGTKYYYAIESNGVIDNSEEDIGSFTTPLRGAFSYSFVLGSCAINSDHPVYDAMREMKPLFYLNMGDLHYSDINSLDINAYRSAYANAVLTKAPAARLLREVPIVYMWDDHDFCGNDSDGSSEGKTTARLAYQEHVPHYPLAAGSGDVPIYQAFTIGRVRFIMTDLRSERTSRTVLGEEQKKWLFNEMINARNNNEVIAWITTVPFMGGSGDTWGGYASERRELSDFFREHITNLFILGGDAHMLAIDDGGNADYSTGMKKNSSRYPIFQASAINQGGSTKGGNYSHGTYPNPSHDVGQFGVVTVTDNGDENVCIEFKGYRIDRNDEAPYELLSYSFCREIGEQLKFKIYPNPAQRSFKLLIYNSQALQSSTLIIRDLDGRHVMEQQLDVVPGENTFEIRADELREGVYIVQFVIDNESHTTKLMITR